MIKVSWSMLLVLVTTLASGADARNLNVDGASLTVRTLPGYCDSSDPELLDPLNRMASRRKAILISAPCNELTAFKNGTEQLQKYVIWTVGTTESGTADRLPTSVTRSEFATEMAKPLRETDMSSIVSEANKKIRQEGLGIEIGNESMGLIDRDSDALYSAGVADYASDDGSSQKKAVVMGVAAVHHLAVAVYDYDRFSGSETFSELLTSVKSLVRAALSDNTD